jgi:signal transduction histidine kinase
LISNAIKFTSEGYVAIKCQPKGKDLIILVTDTGPGIPFEDRNKVFEKFYRSLSTSHKTKGTGLGLFIVKSFVDQMMGRIEIHDHPGKGTVFSLILKQR